MATIYNNMFQGVYRKKIGFVFLVYIMALIAGRFYYNEVYDAIPQQYGTILAGDQGFYDTTALHLAQGKGYSLNGKATCAYQIGYPLFLGTVYYVFGHHYRIAIIIQIMLLSAAFLLYILLAVKINKSMFFIPAMLFIANYNFIQRAYSLMTETLALFLFMLSAFLLYCFLQYRKIYYIFFAALAYGYLILVRSAFQLYPIVLLLYAVLFLVKGNYKTFLRFFLFFFISFIITVPVLARNYKRFGLFSLSALGGYMFYQGTNTDADGIYQGSQRVDRDLHLEKYYNAQEERGDITLTRTICVVNRVLFKEGVRNIKRHPIKAAILVFKNMSRLLFYRPYAHYAFSLQKLAVSYMNMAAFVCMLTGFYRIVAGKVIFEYRLKMFALFCYSAFFYYSLVSGFFAVDPRYGLYPLLIVYLMSPVAFLMCNVTDP